MNQLTVDIFRDIVSSMTADVVVTDVVNNGDGTFTLSSDCTWWIRPEETHSIGGNDYIITDFLINQWIKVKPDGHAVVPTPTTIVLDAPTYIHGTLKMAANEVNAETDKTKLCPFIYLFEIITERDNNDEESMIDREVELRFFFLNSVNSGDWLTEQHYQYFVAPMKQMVKLFYDKIRNSKLFIDNARHDDTTLINVSENGTQEKSVFDCNLSGIESRMFAEIREDLSCINKCKC